MASNIQPESDLITAAVNRTVDVIADYRRNQVCPWRQIEAAAGFERYTPHWSAFVRRLKRAVLDARGIALWPVTGQGFKLLTLEEQIVWRSGRRRSRAMKQLSRDCRELAATPDDELSPQLREQKYARIAQTRAARRRVLAADRNDRVLSRPTDAGVRVRPEPVTR